MMQSASFSDSNLVKVPFSLSSPGARAVSLAIFFNQAPRSPALADDAHRGGKEERSVMMVRDLVPLQQPKPGLWRCEVNLAPGWYEYLFLVDGAWVMDPDAAEVRPDGAGGFNAARKVEAAVAGAVAAVPAIPPVATRRSTALRRAG
jgi:hypothetical protein